MMLGLSTTEPATVHLAPARPYVTYGIMAVIAIAFGVGVMLDAHAFSYQPRDGQPSALLAAGGLSRQLVLDGEWYRLVTWVFLGPSWWSVGFSALSVVPGGIIVETLAGRLWLLALFVVGSLAGSVGWCTWGYSGGEFIVGGAASPGMALTVAALIFTCRRPMDGRVRRWRFVAYCSVWALVGQMVSPSYAGGLFQEQVCGAVAGGIVALFLLRTWPRTAEWPRFRWIAGVVAFVGILWVLVGFAMIHRKMSKNAVTVSDSALLKDSRRPERPL